VRSPVTGMLTSIGGVVVRCRGEAVRGRGAAARDRFAETAEGLLALETASDDLPGRLVLQRLRSAATSSEGEAFGAAFYDAAGSALARVHVGDLDFEAAIGVVEILEARAGIPLPAPSEPE
jgi:homogentisate 1,2-dioxygenase